MSDQVQVPRTHLQGLVRLAPMLVGNVVLPYLIYAVLAKMGFSVMIALTASAVPPLVFTVFTALRKNRLDALGILSLVTIGIAIGTAMLTGNARFMLAKDGLFPLVLGLAMLISSVIGKPLIFLIIRRVFAVDNPELRDRLERAWRHEGYRHALRRYTAVAGFVLLVLVVIQVGGAFTLPVGVALPVLNLLQIVISGALVIGIRTAQRKSLRSYADLQVPVAL